MNAETFDADEALEIGLVNSIMTQSEFAAYVAAETQSKTIRSNVKHAGKTKETAWHYRGSQC